MSKRYARFLVDRIFTTQRNALAQIPKERDTVTVLEGRVEAIDKELEKDFDVLRRKKEFVDEQLEPETIKLGELTAALGVCKVLSGCDVSYKGF